MSPIHKWVLIKYFLLFFKILSIILIIKILRERKIHLLRSNSIASNKINGIALVVKGFSVSLKHRTKAKMRDTRGALGVSCVPTHTKRDNGNIVIIFGPGFGDLHYNIRLSSLNNLPLSFFTGGFNIFPILSGESYFIKTKPFRVWIFKIWRKSFSFVHSFFFSRVNFFNFWYWINSNFSLRYKRVEGFQRV